MASSLSDLLGRITPTTGDLGKHTQLGERLPLVHRAGKARSGRRWTEAFIEQRLQGAPGTDCEQAVGWQKAVYFFVGCGPYPDADLVGIVLEHSAIENRPHTATPLDSGALCKGFLVRGDDEIPSGDRCALLAEHTLAAGERVAPFAGCYVRSLFDDPQNYVRSPQRSVPQYAPYHRLSSRTSDRRAWSLEVQCYDDVSLDFAHVRYLVPRDRDVWLELPTSCRRKSIDVVSGDGMDSARSDSLGEAIARRILEDLRPRETGPA